MKIKRIIPAILVHSKEEFFKNVGLVEDWVDRVQLDVMDGIFVPDTTFADIAGIGKHLWKCAFEIHAMASREHFYVERWALAGASRFIFHYESVLGDTPSIIRAVKKSGMKCGLAINPETEVSRIASFLSDLDYVLVMTVNPGKSAQGFLAAPLAKISEIKKYRPGLPVGIDGGVNDSNIARAYAAGADYFSVNSAIFSQEDPLAALQKLSRAAGEK
ncbi:MAG: ribulose-phosphate 3-epimerase [Parcubacteria group bacterium Gr01-1014_18]|nr:MAG: ribulose-phosphate 3-epimerase [Parcubacteria group bacterium Greene0416_36]TSC80209.1 MAG: ribulose-phosphate 3-epimerase [Parcubacteria group bacterium Gr01-1014_18]TSC98391.1 MAG: ribulose-phosphate 3-epimerase [Parcubacteria group bacterium Greene1014_20]TSD06932.1 MAG: ribulose-phosphate 3-epimerase [Parcubacteria group bacterium Greene0714_2]